MLYKLLCHLLLNVHSHELSLLCFETILAIFLQSATKQNNIKKEHNY
jgi:hypothetical protein